MTAPPSPRWLWGALGVIAAAYFASFAFYPGLFTLLGVNHYGVWFLDSFAILASNDALARGLDPYVPNALDYFNRPHVYSHWWLGLGKLGLTRADNFWLGLSLVIAFFAAAVAWLRPREPRELLWYLAIFCSSPILLAINRANNDLVVFVLLAPVVPLLLHAGRWVRLGAVFLIAVAAGLKFYPAIAGLVLLTGDDAREGRGRVLIAVVALAVVGANLRPDLAQFGGLAPRAEGLMTFGARNLLEPLGFSGWRATALGLGCAAVVVAAFLRSRRFAGWEIAPGDRADWLAFTLGAALLAGCFFTGTNYAYRFVFALWLAPLLWRLPRDARAPAAVRRLAALTGGLMLYTLWADGVASAALARFHGHVPADTLVRWADRFFLLEQPLVWAFFCCLLGFLAHFARGGLLGRPG
ncbi:MAG: hypothetical protein EXS32_12470 [Opitutus sp.]|nr:hypothetical protein [Opitutus sp.]